MWFRSKERGTRARSSDGGDRSGLNHTRGKRGEVSSRFYFLVNFSPALLCSWLCIILDPTTAPENYPLLSFVSFLSFSASFCFLFCHTYHIRMRNKLFHFPRVKVVCPLFDNFSRDKSCDSVWPMKSSLHRSGRRKRCSVDNLSNFLRNFQTSSCFYQSCSHGLIQSSHQAFNYPKLLRDRSKDGLHVAAFSLLDSWSLGNKLIEFISNCLSNFLPLNSQGLSVVFTFEKKTASYQFSIGP